MKAVIGILVIFVGFFIEYSVFTGKLPPSGGIIPPTSPSLPTTQNTSGSFKATTGQGSTTINTYGTYQPPAAGGYKTS